MFKRELSWLTTAVTPLLRRTVPPPGRRAVVAQQSFAPTVVQHSAVLLLFGDLAQIAKQDRRRTRFGDRRRVVSQRRRSRRRHRSTRNHGREHYLTTVIRCGGMCAEQGTEHPEEVFDHASVDEDGKLSAPKTIRYRRLLWNRTSAQLRRRNMWTAETGRRDNETDEF